MIKTIFEKEIRDSISSTKFIITFAVCSVLIILSFYVGIKNYELNQLKYEAGISQNLRQLESLTDWISVREFRAFLPPQPLESLINGVSNDIGRTAEIAGRGELIAHDSRYGDEPIFAVFRFLDLEFVFQVILSLFAILFAYDAVNGEKERGTLRLTFANSVPRDKFILGKLFGASSALLIPLLIPILIGAALIPLTGISFTSSDWLSLSFIIFTGFVYISAFLILSIFISSLTEKSSTSFLMLLIIWIFSVMIIPRLSIIGAGAVVNVPGLDEINSKKARYTSQLWTEDRNSMSNFKPGEGKEMDEVMQKFNKFMSEISENRERKLKEFSSRLNEERKNKENEMQQLAFSLARVSPAAAFSLAASKLAGTSINLPEKFGKSLADYQIEYGNFIQSKTGMNPGGRIIMRISSDNDEKKEPINPAEIPQYKFEKYKTSELVSAALPDFGILIFFNIIFFAGAFFSFRKFDVR